MTIKRLQGTCVVGYQLASTTKPQASYSLLTNTAGTREDLGSFTPFAFFEPVSNPIAALVTGLPSRHYP